ncbi:MAG TPA: preprotein translocase subunit SecG [Blastocatellia bacterium]|nr:preprotein translocase subunit SecG [Blastocatellia bacterium]
MIGTILLVFYITACLILILFVLLQPSKSDASTVFGGGLNSTAFGPRGTQTVLAKVTITAAIAFFLIAFLFSIPGLFEKKSLGESSGPAESQPAPMSGLPTTPAPVTTEQAPPATSPAPQPANTSGAATPAPPAGQQERTPPTQSRPPGGQGASKRQ